MIIMSKFIKRLTKSLANVENSLLLGDGFGQLIDLADTFNTVFVVSPIDINIKKRNIIYRETFDRIEELPNISCIVINRNRVQEMPMLRSSWTKYRPLIIIEGEEVIGRDLSKDLYDTGYRAVEQYKDYHVWQKIK